MFADGGSLNDEELQVLRRAQKGGVKAQVGGVRPSRSVAVRPAAASPYPAADARTLGLLGQIDALLKAPPPPPQWALLRALSILEKHAAQ